MDLYFWVVLKDKLCIPGTYSQINIENETSKSPETKEAITKPAEVSKYKIHKTLYLVIQKKLFKTLSKISAPDKQE